MKRKKTNFILFSIGACGYGLIELIWRGHTHWSMLCAGGTVFVGLRRISAFFKRGGILVKGIIGGAFITAVEYLFGIIFNVLLKRNVWDYSRMPFNIGGQVCALYSFFWVVLSMLFIPLSDGISRRLEK